MRRLLIPAAGFLAVVAMSPRVADRPPDPMPPPSPVVRPAPAPGKPDTGPAAVVQARRVEVVDAAGKVAVVLTAEGGTPIAVVNDNGTARRIDLARVAKLLK